MNSSEKKSPGMRGIRQPFKQESEPTHRFKPAVAQLKNAISAQSARRPVAPPVSKPQPRQKFAQAKTAVAPARNAVAVPGLKIPNERPFVRPQVPFKPPTMHAPQLKPALAQAKNAVSAQSIKRPVAPPVFRPQSKPTGARRNTASALPAHSPQPVPTVMQAKTPTAPPAYRPLNTPRCLQTKSRNPPPHLQSKPVSSLPQAKSSKVQQPHSAGRLSVQPQMIRSVNRLPPMPIAQNRCPSNGKAIIQRSSEKKVSEKDLEFGGFLDKYREELFGGLAEVPSGKTALTMYLIPFYNLTEPVKKKILSIRDSQDVHADDLREPHMDEPGHLPHDQIVLQNLTNKQKAYHEYAKGKDNNTHQFLEYHVENSGMGPAFRLLYDFVNDTFYITTTHYNEWHEGTNKQKIKRNPFYKVTFVIKPVKIKLKGNSEEKTKK